MALRKVTSLVILALVGSLWIGCSSKEDQEAYNKYYGKGRQAREEAASSVAADEKKIDPDTINSLSVTDNADREVGGASGLRTEHGGEMVPALGTTTEDVQAATKEKGAEAKKAEPAATPAAAAAPAQKETPADIAALLNKHTCFACHRPYERLVGPAYAEVAKRKYSTEKIIELVHKPEPGNWPGYPPMAPMPQVPNEDITKIAKWINSL
ncbi:hypothetical protein GCM10027275_28330 [Rhabdobacter roseus]|uniref:Cytochrome c551/c552 n=1 Tax=Rhabdobacter roseus TaxID=1655419 RepID=A0A840TME7_9BACT|nr:c-type cytochrome [Rhabdobacter roseus]MBB5284781.1 cytochrome c551/c552 [Rhabdobacter roseus]